MRPSSILRIHATLPLIPRMNTDPLASLRPLTGYEIWKQTQWAAWRQQEGYVGLWKKGEWKDLSEKERDLDADLSTVRLPFLSDC